MVEQQAETNPYAIIYTDGSYVVYDLTNGQYEKFQDAMRGGDLAFIHDLGTFTTKDIRSIVKQKPAPLPPAANPDLNAEDADYIKEHEADWREYAKGGKDV
jgi:hypothetical protein